MTAADKSARSSPASLETMPRDTTPGYREMADLGARLGIEAPRAGTGLHPMVRQSIGDLVRTMNCYYSNLIEGSNTHPISIERAMRNEIEGDRKQRNMQLEARAHVETQVLIDRGDLDGLGLGEDLIRRLHAEFVARLPEDLRFVTDDDTGERHEVLPGEYRTRMVKVGNHIPIEAGLVPSFMKRFEETYAGRETSQSNAAIAAAAGHHRLAWIHPFLDGNGRVARLYSHAFLRRWHLGSELWSVSRGLARSVDSYKEMLKAADARPHGMTDGRGALSQSALVAWCGYFLTTAVDQAEFMGRMLDTAELSRRFQLFMANEEIKGRMSPGEANVVDPRTIRIVEHILLYGEVGRGDVPGLLGMSERQSLRLTKPLEERRILRSVNRQSPLRLSFPVAECDLLFPRLFAPGEAAMAASAEVEVTERKPASSPSPGF